MASFGTANAGMRRRDSVEHFNALLLKTDNETVNEESSSQEESDSDDDGVEDRQPLMSSVSEWSEVDSNTEEEEDESDGEEAFRGTYYVYVLPRSHSDQKRYLVRFCSPGCAYPKGHSESSGPDSNAVQRGRGNGNAGSRRWRIHFLNHAQRIH